MKNKIIFGMLMLLLVPIVSAGLIYKSNENIDLKIPCFNNETYCSGSTICNITITYPNSTIMINNDRMTNQYSFNNYTLINTSTSTLGTYQSFMICNDNGLLGKSTFEFKITGNGKEEPSGVVIVLFAIGFLALLFYLIIILLYILGKFVELDIDILDLAYSYGGYFALFGLFMLEKFYLGNPEIEYFLDWFIYIGATTNIFIPSIGFIISLFKKWFDKKRLE